MNKETGKLLNDSKVNQRIAEAFSKEGADAWFADGAASRFLGMDYNSQEWEQVRDILDVWFDSGCTHAFCLEQRPDLKWPADYLPRRLGPASRLVPFIAARILRHPRPRPL